MRERESEREREREREREGGGGGDTATEDRQYSGKYIARIFGYSRLM